MKLARILEIGSLLIILLSKPGILYISRPILKQINRILCLRILAIAWEYLLYSFLLILLDIILFSNLKFIIFVFIGQLLVTIFLFSFLIEYLRACFFFVISIPLSLHLYHFLSITKFLYPKAFPAKMTLLVRSFLSNFSSFQDLVLLSFTFISLNELGNLINPLLLLDGYSQFQGDLNVGLGQQLFIPQSKDHRIELRQRMKIKILIVCLYFADVDVDVHVKR